MTKKKKIITIVSVCVACVLIIALTVCLVVLPTTYDVEKSLIQKNDSYSVSVVSGQKYTTLTKNYQSAEDEFKIIGFTDIHLDQNKESGDNSINMMIRNIVREKPDLVVFTGDIITASFNERRTKQLGEVMEELGVYWALCLGNHEHDNNFSITRAKMLKILSGYDHCLIDNSQKVTANGTEVWGEGNYVINIQNADGKISQSLYFVDSGQYMTEEDKEKYEDGVEPEDAEIDYEIDGSEEHEYEYDYIKDSQITWYKETVADINAINGSPVLSTVFAHIPVFEVEEAWMEITGERYRVFDEYNDKTYDYSQTEGNRLLYGERREVVCHSGYNSGFFDACLQNGTQAMFFGHDHVNDCIMEYKGMILGYIKAGGYSTYNSLSRKYKKDGKAISVEDHLTYGYTLLSYDAMGKLSFESKENYDLYPELNEKLVSELKKK